jgi:hypothetical protein
MAGCPPVIGYESKVSTITRYCAKFNQRVLQEIVELKATGLEAVVISARWPSYLWQRSISVAENYPNGVAEVKTVMQASAEMQVSFDATLSALERIGIRVLVLAPNPELRYSAPQCIGLGKTTHCDVPRVLNEAWVANSTATLAAAVSRHPNTRLAQLMDFFCDTETCYAKRAGTILYFDDDHITATAARELGRFLSEDMNWLLRGKADSVGPGR